MKKYLPSMEFVVMFVVTAAIIGTVLGLIGVSSGWVYAPWATWNASKGSSGQ